MKSFWTPDKAVLLFAMTLFISHLCWAGESCKELGLELDQMRKAQNQIVVSLADNHLSLAKTLQMYGSSLDMGSSKVTKLTSNSLKKTSSSLRRRGQNALELAERLDQQSEDLILEIQKCLK